MRLLPSASLVCCALLLPPVAGAFRLTHPAPARHASTESPSPLPVRAVRALSVAGAPLYTSLRSPSDHATLGRFAPFPCRHVVEVPGQLGPGPAVFTIRTRDREQIQSPDG